VPQFVNSPEDARPTHQLVFQIASSRKIEQHYPEQDRQDTLPRNAWNRQNNTQRDQQSAKKILRNDPEVSNYRETIRQESGRMVLAKVISRNFNQNERYDREVNGEGYQEQQGTQQN
jgi:hypothetical protein